MQRRRRGRLDRSTARGAAPPAPSCPRATWVTRPPGSQELRRPDPPDAPRASRQRREQGHRAERVRFVSRRPPVPRTRRIPFDYQSRPPIGPPLKAWEEHVASTSRYVEDASQPMTGDPGFPRRRICGPSSLRFRLGTRPSAFHNLLVAFFVFLRQNAAPSSTHSRTPRGALLRAVTCRSRPRRSTGGNMKNQSHNLARRVQALLLFGVAPALGAMACNGAISDPGLATGGAGSARRARAAAPSCPTWAAYRSTASTTSSTTTRCATSSASTRWRRRPSSPTRRRANSTTTPTPSRSTTRASRSTSTPPTRSARPSSRTRPRRGSGKPTSTGSRRPPARRPPPTRPARRRSSRPSRRRPGGVRSRGRTCRALVKLATDAIATLRRGRQDGSIKQVVKTLLASPPVPLSRRVRSRTRPRPGALRARSRRAHATRLSYLGWSSMPDKALFDLAASGQIKTPAILAQQIDRMLADPSGATFHGELRRAVAGRAQDAVAPGRADGLPGLPMSPCATPSCRRS